MLRRSFAVLLALALIAIAALFVVRGARRAGPEIGVSARPSPSIASTASSNPTSRLDESAREIDSAAVTPARSEVAASDEDADAIWIEGKLAFPPGTPADERVEILAWREKSEHAPRTFPVGGDGSFRAAFPKETTRASLDLSAKYLYLASPVVLDLAKRKPTDPPLALSPLVGGRIHGRIVLSPKAIVLVNTIPGSDVRATPFERTSGWRSGGAGERQAQVDGNLSFELNALPGDKYWIHAYPKSALASDLPEVRVLAGRTTEIEIDASLPTRIRGRVVDEKGTPLADVPISVSVGGFFGGWRTGRPTTSEDGTFVVEGLRPGKTTVEASRDRFSTAKIDLGPLVEGDLRENVEIVLPVGGHIAGKVVWPDGRPAADARIDYAVDPASGRDDGFHGHPSSKDSCVAGPDGSFTIAGLGEKLLVLTVHANPNGVARVTGIHPGTDDVLVELHPQLQIRGRAIDDAGQAIPFFRVTARLHGGTTDSNRDAGAVTASGNDGTFTIDGLHDGPWDLVAEAKGFVKSATRRVLLPSDAEEIELVLPRTVCVSGIVVDPSGSPVEGAQVTSKSRTDIGLAMSSRNHSAPTNSEGRFTFSELEPGPRTVSASARGFADSEQQSVDPTPGVVNAELRIRLRLGGKIVGTVVDEAGEPIADPRIRASCPVSQIHRDTTADAAGRFEVSDLAPGTYWVQAYPTERELAGKPEYLDEQMVLASKRTVETVVTEGATTEVVVGAKKAGAIHVHGRILSDRAAPKCRISFSTANVHPSEAVSAEGSGVYELDLDKAGTYGVGVYVQIPGVNGGGSYLRERVDVPDGPRFEHDFVLPSGRISGRVLEADGSPAARIHVTLNSELKQAEPSGLASRGFLNTDDRGRFVFGYLKAQTYRLDAGSTGRVEYGNVGCGVRRGLVLADGGKIDDVEIRLEAGARIEGTVVGPDGRAVAGATVVIGGSGEGFMDAFPLVSDASGRFARDGFPATTAVIRASTKDLVTAEAMPVTLRSGETTRVAITLGKGTRLRVAVQDPTGKFVAANLKIVDARGQSVPTAMWMDDVEFGAEPGPSGLLVGTVSPGRLKITATTHDQASVTREVDVTGDEQTVTLKLGE
jgi:hypothetical protein